MGSGSAKKKRREKGRKGKKYRKVKTEKGLKYFQQGLLLYIIGLAILLVVFIALFRILPDLVEELEDPESEDSADLSEIGGIVGGLCIGGVIFMIAFLLLFLGLLSLYHGRTECKKPHTDSFNKGLYFIIIGIVIAIIGGGIGGVVSHISGIVTAAFIGFGLMYLVYELSKKKVKKLLFIAVVLNIIMGIVIAAVRIWLFSTYDLYETDSEGLLSGGGVWIAIIGINSLTLIPMTVYFLAYRQTYLRVKNQEI
jgi:hypothetical protein